VAAAHLQFVLTVVIIVVMSLVVVVVVYCFCKTQVIMTFSQRQLSTKAQRLKQ